MFWGLEAGLLSLSFLAPLAIVLVFMRPYLDYLVRKGRVGDDVHKVPPTKVPFPAGPLLFAGAVAGEGMVYLLSGSLVPLAVIGAAAVAFAIGLVDDLYVMGPKTKPLLLILAGMPLVVLYLAGHHVYLPAVSFPILGATSEHFTIYSILAVAGFPIVANAFNMMDSFNGQVSGFSLLTSIALLVAAALRGLKSGSATGAAGVLPLVAISAAFLVFNRYPSRAFDGDSGALMLGAMYAALAITGGVEIAAIVAILPAILNSFYVLSSLRGFVERRKVRTRPTRLGDDGRLYASFEPGAPVTIVRMLLLDGPLGEKELVRDILALTAFACLLSVVTSVLTWVI